MKAHFCTPILELGPDFYDPVDPARFPSSEARFLNHNWCKKLDLGELLDTDSEWVRYFCKFEKLSTPNFGQSLDRPLALRYHGHQFQSYNPDLGDGRGFLHGQFLHGQGREEKLYDFGTKGSGTTPYSRRGDGRLTLKGAVREALATEMLESLGVNTSKTFCFFETGESLFRGDEPSPTRSAVLTRLSHSHIRFGTFQRLAYLGDAKNIQRLVEYCEQNYFKNNSSSFEIFFAEVVHRTARLVAEWTLAGFVHGVLNTDNMNVTGESFDYGPYRFLPTYDPRFTAAYFDHSGLYSFARQPATCLWNLQQLGTALQVGSPEFSFASSLEIFESQFSAELTKGFLRRLNIKSQSAEMDLRLIRAFFEFLEQSQAGYEQSYFDFNSGYHQFRIDRSPQQKSYSGSHFENFKTILQNYEPLATDLLTDAYFQSNQPCLLLIEDIESIWKEIADNDDWHKFNAKIEQIRAWRKPPAP